MDMGQVTELWLSCYLVLLSIDSKTRLQDSRSFVTWLMYLFLYNIESCLVNVILESKIFFMAEIDAVRAGLMSMAERGLSQ